MLIGRTGRRLPHAALQQACSLLRAPPTSLASAGPSKACRGTGPWSGTLASASRASQDAGVTRQEPSAAVTARQDRSTWSTRPGTRSRVGAERRRSRPLQHQSTRPMRASSSQSPTSRPFAASSRTAAVCRTRARAAGTAGCSSTSLASSARTRSSATEGTCRRGSRKRFASRSAGRGRMCRSRRPPRCRPLGRSSRKVRRVTSAWPPRDLLPPTGHSRHARPPPSHHVATTYPPRGRRAEYWEYADVLASVRDYDSETAARQAARRPDSAHGSSSPPRRRATRPVPRPFAFVELGCGYGHWAFAAWAALKRRRGGGAAHRLLLVDVVDTLRPAT